MHHSHSQPAPLKKIIIVGGGTAGWMTAAALSRFLNTDICNITLIESDQIGTVGVGEATLPHLRYFNQTLGIDEAEFMRATHATYKMGIEFSGWGRKDDAYIHPFGEYGYDIDGIDFHHFYTALKQQGYDVPISEFSLPVMAAYQEKFAYPSENQRSILSTFSFAFHLDAGLYAKFLREFSEKNGVTRKEGKIVNVKQGDDGSIASLQLESGENLDAELFIDCSGIRALLIGDTLGVDFEDWSQWLPCDAAWAVPTHNARAPLPYTKAMARDAGWQWRIPLQHRSGNGHVFSSRFIEEEKARAVLVDNLEGDMLADPFLIRFKVGHRKLNWYKNCVAIGLSAGFLEPLESTSIHLIQSAITKLLELFPTQKMESSLREEFNRDMHLKFNSVRDFLILHYHATERDDTEFWRYVRTMSLPDELAYRMELFKERGHIIYSDGDLFLEPSWVAVYFGQRCLPEGFDPRVQAYPLAEAKSQFEQLRGLIKEACTSMPLHQDALDKNCRVDAEKLWPKAQPNLYGRRSS